MMIVGGQTEARASTIIGYYGPFDPGLRAAPPKYRLNQEIAKKMEFLQTRPE